jgi:hypothetical protein
VVKLGYFRTVLRDAESHMIYMPNGLFINQSIANAGRGTHTRVAGSFTVSFEDAPRLEALMAALTATLRTLPQADEAHAPVCITCAGYASGIGIAIGIELLFSRGALSPEAVSSAAWVAVGRVVAQEGCTFAAAGCGEAPR